MSKPHLPTVFAIATVAYVLGKLVHEGLGHGGACILTGQQLVAFSTSWCDCNVAEGAAQAQRIERAAGTFANLGVGAIALGLFRMGPRQGTGAYAAWLVATVNLMMGLGYIFTDPLFGFGD